MIYLDVGFGNYTHSKYALVGMRSSVGTVSFIGAKPTLVLSFLTLQSKIAMEKRN